jgi:hypothetical protein
MVGSGRTAECWVIQLSEVTTYGTVRPRVVGLPSGAQRGLLAALLVIVGSTSCQRCRVIGAGGGSQRPRPMSLFRGVAGIVGAPSCVRGSG